MFFFFADLAWNISLLNTPPPFSATPTNSSPSGVGGASASASAPSLNDSSPPTRGENLVAKNRIVSRKSRSRDSSPAHLE